MTIFKKLFRIIFVLVVLIYALIWGFFIYDEHYLLSDENLEKTIQNVHPESYLDYFQWSGYMMRYVSVGPQSGQILLLVHGTPGNVGNRRNFWKQKVLYDRYRIIAADRIGHGKSHPGSVQEDVGIQAASQLALVQHEYQTGAKPVIRGHSYGAPIVAQMAMEYPENFYAAVLASAAIDPDHEVFRDVAKIMHIPYVRYTLPFWAYVAHVEKQTHITQLQKYMKDWDRVSIPIHVIHGTQDTLAPFENALFLQKHIPAEYFSMITIMGGDHFQPFSAVEEWVDLALHL